MNNEPRDRNIETEETEESFKATIALYRQIVETAEEGIWIIDADSKTTYANQRMGEMLGCMPNELLGKSLYDFIDPEWQPVAQENVKRRQQSIREQHDFKFRRMDGGVLWAIVNATPIFENGQYAGALGMITDITARKQTEETLRQSEDRYHQLFHRMLDAFALHEIICNDEGNPVDYRFLQVNPAFEEQIGLPAAEVIGRTILEILPGADQSWIDTYGRVALTGEPAYFERFSQELDKYYQVVAFSPQKGQFATIFEDITARKLAEVTLRKANEELDFRVQERTAELIKINKRLEAEITDRVLAEEVLHLERSKLKGILDTLPGGVYILSQNCDIEYVNPYMVKEFGPVNGQKCYEYFHNRAEACPWCVNERVFSGETVQWEWRFDKVGKTYELFDTPLRNVDGSLSKLEIFYDITTRKEAENQIVQRNRELTAINDIGRAITSSLDLHHILAELLTRLQQVVGAQLCTVGLIDPATEEVTFYQPNQKSDVVELILEQKFKKGEGISGWVIEHKQSVLLNDLTQDPRPRVDLYKQFKFYPHSMGSVPLIVQDTVIGTIGMFHEAVGVFDAADIRLVEAVASQVAVIIQNAALYDAEQKARQRAEILRSAGLALSSSLSIHKVLETLLDHLHAVVPFESAHVYLLDDQDHAVVRVTRGEELWDETERLLDRRIEVGNLRLLEPLLAGSTITIAKTSSQPDLQVIANVNRVQSWLGIPLIAEGQAIGFCALEHSRPAFFTDELVQWAEALTSQAAIAIQNAWLFEQVREGRERLQALSRRLVEVQESERRYISRELHDEAGQTLASLMMGLHLVEREAGDLPVIVEHCRQLKTIANNVMEDIHRLAIDLRPASLDHLGLIPALQQHVEKVSDLQKLTIEFHSNEQVERLSGEVETAIYRIVQEALTNIVRHASATRADVLLDWHRDKLIVIVEDNGIGFDPQEHPINHLGTLGMRERADMLGGTLTIESTSGKGTTIYLEVPYAHPNIDRR
ncbi:MAG TPA: PAS domain S-box protein [Levilinea sp.]|nr:PAS domain S-box protein [Levilinea sp.]